MMKHLKSVSTPKPADCNAFTAIIVGKIAGDRNEYDSICNDLGGSKGE
jgi:hypothetical protein